MYKPHTTLSSCIRSKEEITLGKAYLNLTFFFFFTAVIFSAHWLKVPWKFTDWISFFAGKSSPMLSDDRISLQCLKDFMLLELDLQDIPKLKPTSLHLREFSCRPHEVRDTKAIFRVPFDGCGTTQGTFSNHIVFQNVVDNSQEINRTRVAVRHVPELHYPFSCRYRQKYTLTLREGETREETNEDDNSTREGE